MKIIIIIVFIELGYFWMLLALIFLGADIWLSASFYFSLVWAYLWKIFLVVFNLWRLIQGDRVSGTEEDELYFWFRFRDKWRRDVQVVMIFEYKKKHFWREIFFLLRAEYLLEIFCMHGLSFVCIKKSSLAFL